MTISLDTARVLVAGARAASRELDLNLLTLVVLDASGTLLGVGVSGDSSDNDEATALAGIQSAGLAGQPD